MTKYNSAARQRIAPRPTGPHPIWRGIGCILLVIVPIMTFGISQLIVAYGVENYWPFPQDLLGHPTMPRLLFKLPGLVPALLFIQDQDNLYATLALTFVLLIIIGAFFSLIYAVAYRFVGPPRYGPQDAPPPKGPVRRYKR